MIRLTIKSNGKPIYIAPDKITAICDNREGGAEVYSGHDFSLVKESPEDVARKVLEYRLAVERYKAAYAEEVVRYENRSFITDEVNYAKRELKELAGLEEQA